MPREAVCLTGRHRGASPLLQQMDKCMNTGMLDFASQGYAVITGLLDDNGLASARTLVDRVVSQHRAGAATHLACGVSIADVTRQHPGRNPDIDPQAWPHEPFIISDLIALDGGFAALFHTESLWRCAARLLECEPADVVFHFCNLTRKPRGIGPAVGWHRDAGNQYFASEDNRTLRLLLPLQGMRADNGATAVVPGSHVDPGAAVDNALIPDVPAGAGLALHAAVLHGGSPNRSGQDRDVIVIQFGVRGSTLSHQADEALALAGREAFA